MEIKLLKPKHKIKLLKATMKVLTGNKKLGTFTEIENQGIRVIENILKSIV